MVQPAGEVLLSLPRGLIGAPIGPCAQARLDEAFGFAVGLRRIGACMDMAQPEGLAGLVEGLRAVAAAVVGHHAHHPDPRRMIPRHRRFEEGDGILLALAVENPAEGEARVVVDADMDELPSDAAAAAPAGTVFGDAVSGAGEAAEFLDVEVQELAGGGVLISPDRFGGFEIAPAVETVTREDAPDGGAREAGLRRDPVHGSPLTPQPRHFRLGRGRRAGRAAVGSRRPVLKPGQPMLAKPPRPSENRADADPHGASNVGNPFATLQAPNHDLSTFRRQSCILVHVHSVLPEALRFVQTSASQERFE